MPARLVDLFAGCGGITTGFVASEHFAPVGAVEWDVEAAATYAANFGDEHLHVGDIAEWPEDLIPDAEVVVGGPPCQGFSALGRRDPDDPRSALWNEYLRVLQRVDPELFVIENVPQFLKSQQFAQLQAETRPRGRIRKWALEPHLLNAADFGVPQARRRAIVIGRRVGTPELGVPTRALVRATVKDAIGHLERQVVATALPKVLQDFRGRPMPGVFTMRDLHVTRNPGPQSQARFRAIPPGGNRFHLPEQLKTPGWRRHTTGSGDVMGRLWWDRPSVTIRTEFFKPEKGRYLHPTEHRPITHLEAALIQGFPDSFLWCGGKMGIARQIGNAVPVGLASALAEHLNASGRLQ